MSYRPIPTNLPEMAFKTRMAYAAGTVSGFNLIYIGRAKQGVADAVARWQIQKFTYDANDYMTASNFAQDASAHESDEFEFSWDLRASYSYGV